MSDFNRIRILYEGFYLFVFTAIWVYYNRKGDFTGLARLGKWGFIFILITIITTNIALFVDPDIVRDSANNADFTPFQMRLFNITGSMDYSYIQAVICLIPIIVYYIKSRQNLLFPRNILIMILILLVLSELRSQVFANIIITIIITILSLISSKNRLITFITVAISFLVIIIIPTRVYSDLISGLSSNFNPESVIYNKLTGIVEFIENPGIDSETDIGRRAERYPLLFDALSSSPFLGHSSYKSNLNIGAGAHLYWMNRLAIWGIPGFLFFVFVLYRIFRNVSSKFDREYRYYYYLSLLSIILLGMAKAVGGREPWLILIVVIPGLYYYALMGQSGRVSMQKSQARLNRTTSNKSHQKVGPE